MAGKYSDREQESHGLTADETKVVRKYEAMCRSQTIPPEKKEEE
jgi:hypothetical protein